MEKNGLLPKQTKAKEPKTLIFLKIFDLFAIDKEASKFYQTLIINYLLFKVVTETPEIYRHITMNFLFLSLCIIVQNIKST